MCPLMMDCLGALDSSATKFEAKISASRIVNVNAVRGACHGEGLLDLYTPACPTNKTVQQTYSHFRNSSLIITVLILRPYGHFLPSGSEQKFIVSSDTVLSV